MNTEIADTPPYPDPDPDSDPEPGGFGFVVEVSDTQGHLRVDTQAVARLVRTVLEAEGRTRASISVAVVDDSTIRAINHRHLDHDWPTDVISFALSEPGEPDLSGELVVSAEMAATTARQAGVDPWDELALYLVHGLLHLCGHDDRSPEQCEAMRGREREILARAGLSNTFPAASTLATAGVDAGTAEQERARWTV
jgi:probable rRNA maturation factor